MFDYIILIITIIWLSIATISDIKTKEVPNWINYSLIIIALTIYSFKSIHYHTFKPILQSLIGLGVFAILGTLMYYSKQWGGGDTKLLFGLGAALPSYPLVLKNIFHPNLNIPFLATLYINILLIGALYSLTLTTILIIKNYKRFRKKLKEDIKKSKILTQPFIIPATIITILSIIFLNFPYNALITTLLITPILFTLLFISVKTIEDLTMYHIRKVSELVEGDWIAEKIIINNRLIYNPKKSLGVTKKQIELIRKHKNKVKVKEGIAFVPAIFLATIISLIFGNILFSQLPF